MYGDRVVHAAATQRPSATVAATALEAAQAQHTALPGENVAAQLVADLATQILALDDRRYVDLAVNVALSIRRCETRPVSVVVSPARTA